MEHSATRPADADRTPPSGTTAATPSSKAATHEVLQRLRAAGCRVTVPRRAVVEALLQSGHDHITADELAKRVRTRYPDIHRATVYRTLDILQEAGVISHVHMGHGPSTFHLGDNAHHHAVCNICNRVTEVPAEMFDAVSRYLDRTHGWQLTMQHFALSAICDQCSTTAAHHTEADLTDPAPTGNP